MQLSAVAITVSVSTVHSAKKSTVRCENTHLHKVSHIALIVYTSSLEPRPSALPAQTTDQTEVYFFAVACHSRCSDRNYAREALDDRDEHAFCVQQVPPRLRKVRTEAKQWAQNVRVPDCD